MGNCVREWGYVSIKVVFVFEIHRFTAIKSYYVINMHQTRRKTPKRLKSSRRLSDEQMTLKTNEALFLHPQHPHYVPYLLFGKIAHLWLGCAVELKWGWLPCLICFRPPPLLRLISVEVTDWKSACGWRILSVPCKLVLPTLIERAEVSGGGSSAFHRGPCGVGLEQAQHNLI